MISARRGANNTTNEGLHAQHLRTQSGATSPRWTYPTVKTGSGLADSSEELIAESPEICSGRRCSLAQLSDFGTVRAQLSALNGTWFSITWHHD